MKVKPKGNEWEYIVTNIKIQFFILQVNAVRLTNNYQIKNDQQYIIFSMNYWKKITSKVF